MSGHKGTCQRETLNEWKQGDVSEEHFMSGSRGHVKWNH